MTYLFYICRMKTKDRSIVDEIIPLTDRLLQIQADMRVLNGLLKPTKTAEDSYDGSKIPMPFLLDESPAIAFNDFLRYKEGLE